MKAEFKNPAAVAHQDFARLIRHLSALSARLDNNLLPSQPEGLTAQDLYNHNHMLVELREALRNEVCALNWTENPINKLVNENAG